MARPRKNNADYFSHDNNMRNHRKVKALRNKFGLEGYAIWCMFLETLTESDCFKLKLDGQLEKELLAADFGTSAEKLTEVLNYCLVIKLVLWDKKNQLYYSDSLMERLSPLVEKREHYRVKYEKTIVSDAETHVSDTEMPQTKLNKTKLNISKDIPSSKTYKEFRDKRRIESGRQPMTPRKSTEKQKAFMAAAKSGIEYFKEQGQQQHAMDFLVYTNDKRNAIVLKLVMNAYEKIGDLKELIDWWFQGAGEFWKYEPEQCFSVKSLERFKNKQPKEIKPFIINKHE